MAMLAERRKKTKYRLQPFAGLSEIKKRCDDDTSSFGFKMMASMGWAPGKGLGVNESGNVDPIKVRFKNDDVGLGYKVSEDDALAQQSEFQALLLQLNSGSTDGETESGETMKKSKKPKIKSLEKQSEQSSKRVHYKKFTRGKDLSRASEQDLRSILGLTSKKPKEEEPKLTAPEPVKETSLSTNMYITAGSSVDYFTQKRNEKKAADSQEEIAYLNCAEDKGNAVKNKRRSVTWGNIDVSYVDKYIKKMVNISGSVDKSLNNSEFVEEPLAKKKKKKKKKHTSEEEVVEETIQEDTVKKKKKKTKLCEVESSKENVTRVQENFLSKKKKKRKLDVAEQDELVSEPINFVCNKDTEALFAGEKINSNLDSTEEPKKKKKKKRNQVCALSEQSE